MKLCQKKAAILLTAATLLTPATVSAQFTTFVAPPRKANADSVKQTIAETKAKTDSVTRMSLTDMKTWVDSAAGAGTQVASVNDTTMAANTAANVAVSTTDPNAATRTTTSFSNGAIAPNTASPLPTYLLAGVASLTAGLLLLRRRRRA